MLFQHSVSVLHWYNKIHTIKSINGNLTGEGFFDMLHIIILSEFLCDTGGGGGELKIRGSEKGKLLADSIIKTIRLVTASTAPPVYVCSASGAAQAIKRNINVSWQLVLLLLVCGCRRVKFCFRKGQNREGLHLEYFITSERLKAV